MPPKEPLTPKQVPYTGPYSLPTGEHRSKGPTAKALKIAMKRMRQEPFIGKDNAQLDYHYNQALEDALDRTTNASWDGYGEKRWEAVRGLVIPPGYSNSGEYALNKEARDLILTDYAQMTQVVIPEIGPIYAGSSKSLLDYDLTHDTTGIALYPAFDTAFGAGVSVIAPEDVEVVKKDTSADPGEALYLKGAWLLDYWFAHIDRDYPLGTRFKKGQFIGRTVPTSQGGGPHAHIGVNGERLLGVGKQFEYGADGDGPDYTHSPYTIRDQIERALV